MNRKWLVIVPVCAFVDAPSPEKAQREGMKLVNESLEKCFWFLSLEQFPKPIGIEPETEEVATILLESMGNCGTAWTLTDLQKELKERVLPMLEDALKESQWNPCGETKSVEKTKETK